MQIVQNKTWNLPDAFMNELASSLITTAVEGGINYWAQVSDYHWSDEQPETTRVNVYDIEGDAEDTAIPVDVPKMIAAIVKAVSGEHKPFYNGGYEKLLVDRLRDAFAEVEQTPTKGFLDVDFDFDADDADSMMQIAALGEIVYG